MPRIDHNDPATWPIGEDHSEFPIVHIEVNRTEEAEDFGKTGFASSYGLDNETQQRIWQWLSENNYVDDKTTSCVVVLVNPSNNK